MAVDPRIADLLTRMLKATGWTQAQLGDRLGTDQSSISRWRTTQDPGGAARERIIGLATELGLIDGNRAVLIPIVGTVGADSSGRVLYGDGQGTGDMALLPPGADADCVAVHVVGESMGMRAPDGSLLFYSERHDPPQDDMLGEMVIVGLPDGEVLVKRLMRGSRNGIYNLESANGSIRPDEAVSWAAHIQSIVPPYQARRIIRRGHL